MASEERDQLLANLRRLQLRHAANRIDDLPPTQLAQLPDRTDRAVFIAFDSDPPGRNAACALAQTLRDTGLTVKIVDLPSGHDPNSFFTAGASAAEFDRCLSNAHWL
jgi:DNA primase